MANIDYRQQPLEAAKESVRNWLDETALVTKFFILLSIAGSFLSLTSVIGIDLVQIFANIPYKAIIGLQIHRLIFSWALPSSFFGGLFQALSLFTVLQKIEQKRGSVYLLVQILVLNFISQVLFAVFCLFFGLFVQVISVQTSVGMWVLFFNVLPIVLKEPFQERGVPFFLVKIPPVVYPFVLCVFFQFFGFNLDIVFGAVVGHLASYKYRYLELSSSQLKYLEKIWIVRVLRTRAKGFAVSDISEYDGLPHFVPFVGKNNQVGETNDNILGSRFAQAYKPHSENIDVEQTEKEMADALENGDSKKKKTQKSNDRDSDDSHSSSEYSLSDMSTDSQSKEKEQK